MIKGLLVINRVSYKIATIIQGILIILVGIRTVDIGYSLRIFDDLKFNESVFGDDPNEWWNHMAFWAYSFFVVGI